LLIHKRHPALPILITSGTPPEGWSDADFECFGQLVMHARVDYLQKPFQSKAVLSVTEELTNGTNGRSDIHAVFNRALSYREDNRS